VGQLSVGDLGQNYSGAYSIVASRVDGVSNLTLKERRSLLQGPRGSIFLADPINRWHGHECLLRVELCRSIVANGMTAPGAFQPLAQRSLFGRICPRPWKNASYEVSEAL